MILTKKTLYLFLMALFFSFDGLPISVNNFSYRMGLQGSKFFNFLKIKVMRANKVLPKIVGFICLCGGIGFFYWCKTSSKKSDKPDQKQMKSNNILQQKNQQNSHNGVHDQKIIQNDENSKQQEIRPQKKFGVVVLDNLEQLERKLLPDDDFEGENSYVEDDDSSSKQECQNVLSSAINHLEISPPTSVGSSAKIKNVVCEEQGGGFSGTEKIPARKIQKSRSAINFLNEQEKSNKNGRLHKSSLQFSQNARSSESIAMPEMVLTGNADSMFLNLFSRRPRPVAKESNLNKNVTLFGGKGCNEEEFFTTQSTQVSESLKNNKKFDRESIKAVAKKLQFCENVPANSRLKNKDNLKKITQKNIQIMSGTEKHFANLRSLQEQQNVFQQKKSNDQYQAIGKDKQASEISHKSDVFKEYFQEYVKISAISAPGNSPLNSVSSEKKRLATSSIQAGKGQQSKTAFQRISYGTGGGAGGLCSLAGNSKQRLPRAIASTNKSPCLLYIKNNHNPGHSFSRLFVRRAAVSVNLFCFRKSGCAPTHHLSKKINGGVPLSLKFSSKNFFTNK